MSTAVDSHKRDGPRLNGHHELSSNSRSWEEKFLPTPLRLEDKTRTQKIDTRLSKLMLCGAMLRRVVATFEDEIEKGLHKQPSSLQMENTYVPELPDGTEEGVFLALDLGGTNFRVLLLELRAGQYVRQDVKHYHINEQLRMGPGEDLFQFLAECVQDFLRSENMEHDKFSLGFTFSFPMNQHSISSGELITWTKSFKCGGMENVDVAALLQRCLHNLNLDVTVRVLLNDTTGTLVSGAHMHPHVGMGVILGTGSNGCYMERASRILHWESAHERVHDVIVDVEWGAFGDNGCLDYIRTEFDNEVDARSLLVTSFTFEKYISGKYQGDLLTAVLGGLGRDGLFPFVPAPGSMQTTHLSLFEEENIKGDVTETLKVLREVGGVPVTTDDALVAQHAAHLISNRAAQLVSVCISTLLRRMDRSTKVGVAVDGSVFKRHPRISQLMNKYIALLAPNNPCELISAEDGSGKGSALTAAIAARLAARDAA